MKHQIINDSSDKENQQLLHFTVTNPSLLEVGLASESIFDHTGGRIGSGGACKWVLTDANGEIYANHCKIELIDECFCLVDFSGKMKVNHSMDFLEPQKPVLISANDIFNIGPYEIKAAFTYNGNTSALSVHNQTLETLVSPNKSERSSLLLDESEDAENFYNQVDPIQVLDADSEFEKKDSLNHGVTTAESDFDFHMNSPISLSKKKGVGNFDSEDMLSDGHLASGSILRGLKVNLSYEDDSGELQYFAEEIGASLREVIQGLLRINDQVNNNGYGVMNKNFQPIVDNPLKMSMPYEDTIRLMYDEKVSLVHLAAPSALKENLDTIYNHQEATHFGITEALDQILKSFSPEVLMKRFNYYRASRNLSPEQKEAWAWKMYQAYYNELVSNRQTGFKKLFWEIFDQIYDKKIRELNSKDID